MGSCNLADRKPQKAKYVVKIKNNSDTTIYYCDSFFEEENQLILYRATNLSADAQMLLNIKSEKLEYEIKLNQ